MQHHHVPNRRYPIDLIELREQTSSAKDIEQAFYEMLEAVDDDAEELQEFVGGPLSQRQAPNSTK
jgi:hypothetical protein